MVNIATNPRFKREVTELLKKIDYLTAAGSGRLIRPINITQRVMNLRESTGWPMTLFTRITRKATVGLTRNRFEAQMEQLYKVW